MQLFSKGSGIKVLIGVDQLLERDMTTSMVETLLSIGHEVEIFTLVHKAGNIVGPLYGHKITSSYLSLFFKKKISLLKFPNWTRSAAKQFKIPKADFYLFLSSGFIHLCKTDPKIPRVDYLYGPARDFKKLASKSLIRCCSKTLGDQLGLEGEHVVIPAPFISRDFPVMGKYYENKNVLLRTENLNRVQLYKILTIMGPTYRLKIITNNSKVKALKEEFPHIEFLPELNSGTLYIELLRTLVFIDYCEHPFPVEAFCALCTGVPLLTWDKSVNREFLSDDVALFFNDFEDLKLKFTQFLEGDKNFKPEILRRYALRFNERIFKNRFLKLINS